MSALRGWCPTATLPMPSGDGLLARVRPPAATLRATQARALGAAVARWGNGIIELTGRGNLQGRGFSAATFPRFLDAICAAGLADLDPLAEGRLRVIAAPLLADAALLARLEAALRLETTLDRLGSKFAIRVDGGAIPIRSVAADLAIDPDGIELGAWRAVAADPVGAATACIRGIAAEGLARARDLEHPASFLVTLGLAVAPAAPAGPPPATIGAHAWGIGLAPRFGQLDGRDLADLAAIAEAHGDGTLRITPFRSILLPGAGERALLAAAHRFAVRPDDPRLRIRACIGAPGCLSGQAPARAVAEDFLPLVPVHGILHLSGCAKGCAHPKPAARTFIGRNGRLEEHVLEAGAA